MKTPTLPCTRIRLFVHVTFLPLSALRPLLALLIHFVGLQVEAGLGVERLSHGLAIVWVERGELVVVPWF